MIDIQLGAEFKPSLETTITGRRPDCSEPDRGSRFAFQISPRFISDFRYWQANFQSP